jgi:hypothetical protein
VRKLKIRRYNSLIVSAKLLIAKLLFKSVHKVKTRKVTRNPTSSGFELHPRGVNWQV